MCVQHEGATDEFRAAPSFRPAGERTQTGIHFLEADGLADIVVRTSNPDRTGRPEKIRGERVDSGRWPLLVLAPAGAACKSCLQNLQALSVVAGESLS
jgi:hypothetical protein